MMKKRVAKAKRDVMIKEDLKSFKNLTQLTKCMRSDYEPETDNLNADGVIDRTMNSVRRGGGSRMGSHSRLDNAGSRGNSPSKD